MKQKTNPRNNARYRKIRAGVLLSEPLCRPCRKQGRIVGAVQVDHIVPLSEGGELSDRSNLQPICADCHKEKSALEYRGVALDKQVAIDERGNVTRLYA